jgi:hypothetical protein
MQKMEEALTAAQPGKLLAEVGVEVRMQRIEEALIAAQPRKSLADVGVGECRSKAFAVVRGELALGNMTLEPGGFLANKDNYNTALALFTEGFKATGDILPLGAAKLFRSCFAAVLKAERRKTDAGKYAFYLTTNAARQWRQRLSVRLLGCWGVLTANGTADQTKLEGVAVLGTDYMPHIAMQEGGGVKAYVYTPLGWLSEKAQGIQKQCFDLLKLRHARTSTFKTT